MAGRITAVLFDFDGTLSDSLLPIHGIINAMRAERGAAPREAALMRPAMSFMGEALVKGCLDDAARDAAGDLAEFRRRYGQVQPDAAHLYPGTVEMLEALKQAGLRCAICSNKPHDILVRFVEGTGLAPYFELVVGGSPARKGKPDPEMVHHVLEQMNVAADEAVLVRDRDVFIRLRDRIAIARAAGADLLVSLHADAIDDARVRGLSVYTLSENASDKEAEMLADRDATAGIALYQQNIHPHLSPPQ